MSASNGPPRIPLVAPFDRRAEIIFQSLDQPATDALVINGVVEQTAEGEAVVKRPGFSLAVSAGFLSPGAIGGQGCASWNGDIYYVFNARLFRGGGILIGVIGTGLETRNWTFTSVQGAVPKLVLQNTIHVHTWDGATLLLNVVTGKNFLPGAAYLDGTLYMAQLPNNIQGSGINDPATWNPLNVLQAQLEPDKIIYILKQHQYVVALKEWTTEFFWDAGNPVGSPLQPATGATFDFGCKMAETVCTLEDTVIWVAQSKSGAPSVMMMQNLQPKTISTPAIERILEHSEFDQFTTSWSIRVAGHRYYCLTLFSQFSLVYDLTTERWLLWTFGAAQRDLPFVAAAAIPGNFLGTAAFFQHRNGSLYKLDTENFTDDADTIPVDIYTPNWDGGSRKGKVLQRLEVIGDQSGMQQCQLRWSDDDFQTWSQYRDVDLARDRPFIDDLGKFHRRAFHLHYNAATPFRVKALECTNIMECPI